MNTESVRIEPSTLKTVGSSGQISIGKAYAGKTLKVTVQADGSMLLTPVVVVPENQLWTVQEPHRTAIARGLAYATAHAASETDVDALELHAQRHAKENKRG